jgi:hypothetical protein
MSEPSDYVAAQIRHLLAEGGLGELSLDVKVADGRVVLVGHVESDAVRRAICQSVRDQLADLDVCDEMTVVDATAPADHEEVR